MMVGTSVPEIATADIDAPRVRVTRNEGIVEVELTRPHKMNAMDNRMLDELADVAKRLLSDRSARVVILHGQGESLLCRSRHEGNHRL